VHSKSGVTYTSKLDGNYHTVGVTVAGTITNEQSPPTKAPSNNLTAER
jgi:hypothetical protein